MTCDGLREKYPGCDGNNFGTEDCDPSPEELEFYSANCEGMFYPNIVKYRHFFWFFIELRYCRACARVRAVRVIFLFKSAF